MNPRTRALREFVWAANLELADSGLVTGTFGNVSGADRDAGLFAIKPSGVPYAELTPDHMVLVSLETGEVARGDLRPSSDTPTHHELYRAFPCGGIAPTPSSRPRSRRRGSPCAAWAPRMPTISAATCRSRAG